VNTNIKDMDAEQLDELARQLKTEADRKRGGKEIVLAEDELNALGALLGNRRALDAVEKLGHDIGALTRLQAKVARAQGFDEGGLRIYWG